ncbi:MAG: protein translocase subunit SecF, partial [Sulfurovum sp.]|nr:protein translocase subunit SecF [Sulfurovum sp.]
MEIFKYKKPLSLMSKSKRFGLLSVTVLVLALGLIIGKGFNYGIDFAGGTLIQVKYEGKAPIDKVREAIDFDKSYEGATVTFFGSE